MKRAFWGGDFTIFQSHQFVWTSNLSLMHILLAFQMEKIYPTCSRRGRALLYFRFSGSVAAGTLPGRLTHTAQLLCSWNNVAT